MRKSCIVSCIVVLRSKEAKSYLPKEMEDGTMYVITEDHIEKKVAELLKKNHWQRVCLLVLFSVRGSKLVSRSFIYEKLSAWTLVDSSERVSILKTITTALCELHEKGYVRREDLSRLNQKDFNKACAKILGTISTCPKYRTQTAYKISPIGRSKAKKLFKLQTLQRGCDRCAISSMAA